ncbi:hypothetical protein KC332_g13255 [Hortaea werneckii]|uniref:HTH APSES-type domain-containing protein n=1 Tax=Hortaea werneckii TaxID=91943 RepID=A0A3M7I6S9_HORWE|nr:hypothetical protein KC358_g13173 [Hortaea werneckii]KAI6809566.1 hypothetical protein KC350_g12887 [Hortaea werneckii]KAI6910336.1 hypothetical protein KC348_g13245 [Hortaea werneckii]KAI6926193.1 hypothetical protein KC341_g12926 [Hortaea werneckii]KAI6959919.1 hypothetical protein KC321_g13147 [Hortaea werneckii]
MSSTSTSLPSPSWSEFDHTRSAEVDTKPVATGSTNMLKINSLLNPPTSEHYEQTKQEAPEQHERTKSEPSPSPPPTPAYTPSQYSWTSSSPVPLTPTTPSTKPQKLVKDAAVFIKGPTTPPVNYPPYESNETSICLSAHQQAELWEQHDIFDVRPDGRGKIGFIGEFPRRIPYASDKKDFHEKTNRDAFYVFHYEFSTTNAPNKKHVVMWDYQIGLVRITPFFKALGLTKTTPNKALRSNKGLFELSHSITGGAIVAQGYWLPYSCARALCQTFCYPIRWALTPVFGPSFIKDCLRPEHPDYGRFKVSSEVISCAHLEAESLLSGESTRSDTPKSEEDDYDRAYRPQQIPRSVPEPLTEPSHFHTSARAPAFKLGSPFESDSESSQQPKGDHDPLQRESPGLSPKSSFYQSPSWTSINGRNDARSPPIKSELSTNSVSRSLFNEPRSGLTMSWRATDTATLATNDTEVPFGALQLGHPRKRRVFEDTSAEDGPFRDADVESNNEEDAVAQVESSVARKRLRREEAPAQTGHGRATPPKRSKKYNANDARAAQWLLNLSTRDSQLAVKSEEAQPVER